MSRCLSSLRRVPVRVSSAIILVMVIVLSSLTSSAFGARIAYVKSAPPKVSPAKMASIKVAAQSSQGAGSQGQRIWLAEPQSLQVTHVPAAGVQNLLAPAGPDFVASQPQPLSMINGDFDGDGIEDLAVGYATPGGGAIVLHRGNLDAFAPQSQESWIAIGQGRFPQPFLAEAQVVNVPIRPDFIAVGNFSSQASLDLVVASRNGNTLYVLAGDGQGNFAAPQGFSVSGGITALAAGQFGNRSNSTRLMIGVRQQGTFSLWVLGKSLGGLKALATYPLGAPATTIAFGDFGDSGPDAAILAGGQVSLLHSSSMQLETLSLPVSASAMTLGWFIFDRNPDIQIALLTSDGSIHIAAHNEFDPRPRTNDEMRAIRQAVLSGEPNPLVPRRLVATNGWRIVESIPSVAPFSPGQP
ncbi:MAG TPA: VCBS repeat-containing protein, partial [Candidatus Angelobacter sp.]|nr:VCBS repeat-containing protein [Candidatus Angelobacter sp.]